MIHSFDTDIAKVVGVNSAIILNNIYFWIEKNKANEVNKKDGRYWTYNSKRAFSELFPYFSARQIEHALKKLIDDGILITGNYNKLAYDRTLWYSITEKGYAILEKKSVEPSGEAIPQKCEMHFTKVNDSIIQECEMEHTNLCNGTDKFVEPIPDIKQDIKPNSNKKESKKVSKISTYDEVIKETVNDDELKELYMEFIKMRKLIKSPMTNRALEMLIKKVNKLEPHSIENQKKLLENSIMNNWKTVYPLKEEKYNSSKQPQQQEQKSMNWWDETI